MEPSDYKHPPILDYISWAILIALFLLPVYYYNDLPDQIPSHFNAKGIPDDYNAKSLIWVLPILGTGVFLLLHFLSTAKNLKVNTPRQLTPRQEEQQQLVGRKMLHALKLVIPAAFLYILYHTIQTALGHTTGLGPYFLYIFVLIIFSIIGYFMIQAYRVLDDTK